MRWKFMRRGDSFVGTIFFILRICMTCVLFTSFGVFCFLVGKYVFDLLVDLGVAGGDVALGFLLVVLCAFMLVILNALQELVEDWFEKD